MVSESNDFRSKHLLTDWDVQVFFDGDCPLCRREISALRRMDRAQKIRFTNIAAPEFRPEEHGFSMDQFMSEIHGRLPDGRWVRGLEVFRRLYAALGWTPVVRLSRLPIIAGLLDRAYRLFARNRLRWTGRCTPHSESCRMDKRDARQNLVC